MLQRGPLPIHTMIAVAALSTGVLRGQPSAARFVREVPWAGTGVWLKIDTHTHTTFSDGVRTVDELLNRATVYGCDAVAITDHTDLNLKAATPEYFDAIEKAREARPNMIVFAGVEWNIPPAERQRTCHGSRRARAREAAHDVQAAVRRSQPLVARPQVGGRGSSMAGCERDLDGWHRAGCGVRAPQPQRRAQHRERRGHEGVASSERHRHRIRRRARTPGKPATSAATRTRRCRSIDGIRSRRGLAMHGTRCCTTASMYGPPTPRPIFIPRILPTWRLLARTILRDLGLRA